MPRIRVLQVVTRLVLRGVPYHVLEVAAGLDPKRYEVDILAGQSEPGEDSLWEEAQARGVRTIRVESLKRAIDPWAEVPALAAIYKQIRHGRYDIVHTHISKAGLLGRLAAKLAGTSVIVHTYHGMIRELADLSFKGRLLTNCEKWVASMADALITISHAEAERLKAKGVGYKEAYRVIYNGIDLSHFNIEAIEANDLVENDQRFSIGYIGSLTPEKGVDILLGSMAVLKERCPNIRLYIVGEGYLLEQLKEQATNLDLGDVVRFVGGVRDVRPWLKAFDVLVVPSRSEGLPYVVIETLAMQRPVVASNVGGIPEIIGTSDAGILVPIGDVEGFACAIEKLLQDVVLRCTMGKTGRVQVERYFNRERMLDQVDQLYTELLEGKGRL